MGLKTWVMPSSLWIADSFTHKKTVYLFPRTMRLPLVLLVSSQAFWLPLGLQSWTALLCLIRQLCEGSLRTFLRAHKASQSYTCSLRQKTVDALKYDLKIQSVKSLSHISKRSPALSQKIEALHLSHLSFPQSVLHRPSDHDGQSSWTHQLNT